MIERKKFILTMDLTPNFMSGSALRKHVGDHRWRKIIRKALVAERGLVCDICRFPARESKIIDAHEVFDYPEDGTVRLVAIQLLCTWCHDIKDFAQMERLIAQRVKRPERRQLIIEHFCHVNECPLAEFDEHYEDARRRVRAIEKRYGPVITPDQVHYGDFHDHYVKAQDPARFNGWTAAQHAIAVAIRRGVHEDYREEAIEIAKENDDFRDEILCLVKRKDYDAAVTLVIETIQEYCDIDDDPLPGHEFIYTSDGELYGHHWPGE